MQCTCLIFIAGLMPAVTLAQNDNMDRLATYSYYVFGKQPTPDGKSMQTVEGTCFFVKAGAKTFLVSAKHLLTGWSTSDAEKESVYPDTLFIRFAVPGGKRVIDYPLDIKEIKAEAAGSFYYNEPDLFVMEFQAGDSIRMNTIDAIQLRQPPAATSAASIVYGFPKIAPFHLEGRLFSAPGQNITYRDHKRNVDISDTINYLIKCSGPVARGYSGAPVFLKNDGSDEWYFGGVVSQGVPGENYFFVVKPDYLLRAIAPGL
jgi:hypothetical protein